MNPLSFIIVDDRELDCFIAEKLLEKISKEYTITSFYSANSCLEHIRHHEIRIHTIILLDIMMPVMTGFDFMEEFEKLDTEKKRWYKIVPITTSLNKNEILRISKYSSVIKVLQKPYSLSELKEIIEETRRNILY